eukprot:scaffold102962_cov39-Tisochrysis_lutea.AAC.1
MPRSGAGVVGSREQHHVIVALCVQLARGRPATSRAHQSLGDGGLECGVLIERRLLVDRVGVAPRTILVAHLTHHGKRRRHRLGLAATGCSRHLEFS